MTLAALKENTWLPDQTFPINIFRNQAKDHNVLTLHWHEHLELIYIIEGDAIFDIGSQSFSVTTGDILFINGGQLHSGYSIHNQGVDYYAIVYNPSLLFGSSLDLHQAQTIGSFLTGEKHLPNLVQQTDPSYKDTKQWILNTIEEFDRKDFAYEINIKSYLQLILVHFSRHIPLTVRNTSRNIRQAEGLKPVLTYLEKAFSLKISLEHAAKLVNLSPHHFCRSFKKATGRTFIEYLHIVRINEAERLLKTTELSITRIAEQVGFCNINYFDKVFKKIKRYPPSTARKQF
jgi:AraC-like DNA-binding protein/mannose-6-phosphate isomerase-like protein (cupin superfamily)